MAGDLEWQLLRSKAKLPRGPLGRQGPKEPLKSGACPRGCAEALWLLRIREMPDRVVEICLGALRYNPWNVRVRTLHARSLERGPSRLLFLPWAPATEPDARLQRERASLRPALQ